MITVNYHQAKEKRRNENNYELKHAQIILTDKVDLQKHRQRSGSLVFGGDFATRRKMVPVLSSVSTVLWSVEI